MWSETNQAVCSYCILLCFSILHQTVASDFLLQIRRWGTYIINFLCISCQIFVVYFKVEVWDFNVLTVVGIMFTNNRCGNFRNTIVTSWIKTVSSFQCQRKEIILLQRLKIFSVWRRRSMLLFKKCSTSTTFWKIQELNQVKCCYDLKWFLRR